MSISSDPDSRAETIFITGGRGFVGRRLVKVLRAKGNSRRVFVGVRSGEHAGYDPMELPLELLDPATIDQVIKQVRPDVVIHLAAQSSVARSGEAALTTWDINLVGSLNLGRSLMRYAPDATMLFASSSEVYGLAFNRGTVSESSTPEPTSSYGWSKFAAEHALADVLRSSARLIVTRPSNHSGAGQEPHFALPSFARQICSGSDEILVGNLSAERDFLHVDDVVAAYDLLLSQREQLPIRCVFNIASGRTRSMASLLQDLLRLAGSAATVTIDEARLRSADIPAASIDATALRNVTGWRPSRSLDDMLLELLSEGRGQTPRSS